jgi:drug/metabolite transporter (DMT)-like permease
VSAAAFALALAAAALHAGWNVLLAGARDVRAATTVALVLSVALFAPVAALTWDVELAALRWMAASAALEIAYFVLLTAAYRRSDVSLVYPIARGVAPILVLLGATIAGAALGGWQALGVVALRERVGVARAAGSVLVVAGVALVAAA